MIVLGIDPGAAGAGYCVWHSGVDTPVYVGSTRPSLAVDAIVIESGFVGRMGRKAMWGLGFDAGWRLCEALGQGRISVFTIRPDGKNGWRANLPDRPGFKNFDGLPGDVIVNRLRSRYGLVGEHTEHEIEAIGIAEAAAAILQRPKAKDRKALVRVKR